MTARARLVGRSGRWRPGYRVTAPDGSFVADVDLGRVGYLSWDAAATVSIRAAAELPATPPPQPIPAPRPAGERLPVITVT